MTQEIINKILELSGSMQLDGDNLAKAIQIDRLVRSLSAPAAPDAEALEAFPQVWHNKDTEEYECLTDEAAKWFIENHKIIRAALQSQAPSVDDAELDELLTKEDVRELEINRLLDGTYKAWIYPRPMDLEKVRRGIDKTPLSALKRALSGTAKKVGE